MLQLQGPCEPCEPGAVKIEATSGVVLSTPGVIFALKINQKNAAVTTPGL